VIWKLHRQRSPGHLKKNIAQYKCMGLKSLSAYHGHGGDTCSTVDSQFYIIISILMAKLLNRIKSGERNCATIPE